MAKYKVYIFDSFGNSAEVETEGIDFRTVFAVADLNDIASRRDAIKQVQFKGTKNNNLVFGSIFDLSRSTDLDMQLNINFNYNSLNKVTALVYEDSELIYKGTIRLVKVTYDKDGNVVYNTIITGSLIDLKVVLQDRLLNELDFNDLTHRFNIQNIVSSWSGTNTNYDYTTSSTTVTTGYTGWVYPAIDYGYSAQTNPNIIHINNYKPAVYLTTYFDKIFGQPDLDGYTYEIAGNDNFKTLFKSVIIPDTNEGNLISKVDLKRIYRKSSVLVFAASRPLMNYDVPASLCYNGSQGYNTHVRLIPIDQQVNFGQSDVEPFSHVNQNVIQANRILRTSGKVNFTFTNITNTFFRRLQVKVQLVSNPSSNFTTSEFFWNKVIAEKEIFLDTNETRTNWSDSLSFQKSEVRLGDTLAVRLICSQTFLSLGNATIFVQYNLSQCELIIPAETNEFIEFEPLPSFEGIDSGDLVYIKPPAIKQLDFVKNVINLFNLYVYTRPEDSKRLIFEPYDDFYSQASINLLPQTALDWTNKVDYSKGFNLKPNTELPKSYSFKFKGDKDYLNDFYTKKFNEVYGQFLFTDSKGVAQPKTIELIFAPTVCITEELTDRVVPCMYAIEQVGQIINKKVTKTEPRILHYNGIQNCVPYFITGNSASYSATTYGQASNYHVVSGVTLSDIHFGRPLEYYLKAEGDVLAAPTAYESHYINQVSELTNPDVVYLEMDVYLNEVDIANLDLRIPIYIQTGSYNGSYFKLLNLEYFGSDTSSKVLLQKVAL
jgi:hypothetical protein